MYNLPKTQQEIDTLLSLLLRLAQYFLAASAIAATVALLLLFMKYFPETSSTDPPHVASVISPSPRASHPEEPPLKASDYVDDGKHHLLLCATGSVATIKLPNILHALSHHHNLSIRVLLSDSAANFLQAQAAEQPALATLTAIPNVAAIHRDVDEWHKPWVRGDAILHIELRRWADAMVIAPLSANSLAKLALGVSDNLISSIARAWDTTGQIDVMRSRASEDPRKRIIVAPAMNTAMWEHPITRKHMAVLEQEWGWKQGGWVEVLRPVEKGLACGDTGSGAMREWKEIVDIVEQRLGLEQALKGNE
nr:putative phosphopantothenoylcysteine decarboxylase [Quercus suber]